MPRVRTRSSLLPNQSRKLLISFGSIDIKVATLLGVATFFFAFKQGNSGFDLMLVRFVFSKLCFGCVFSLHG